MSKPIIEPSGKRFGNLIVLQRYPTSTTSGNLRYECRCQCGKRVLARGTDLRNGSKTHCGSVLCAPANTRKRRKGGRPVIRIDGQTFGDWLALERAQVTDSSRNAHYHVQCVVCGYKDIIRSASLRRGDAKHCPMWHG